MEALKPILFSFISIMIIMWRSIDTKLKNITFQNEEIIKKLDKIK